MPRANVGHDRPDPRYASPLSSEHADAIHQARSDITAVTKVTGDSLRNQVLATVWLRARRGYSMPGREDRPPHGTGLQWRDPRGANRIRLVCTRRNQDSGRSSKRMREFRGT
jgi:hypothetical protein